MHIASSVFMARAQRDQVVSALRLRLTRAIAAGALNAGDRVPSTRAMASELDADPRLVSAAYHVLETEGLVEMRERSGVYVLADAPLARRLAAPSHAVLVEALSNAARTGTGGAQLTRSLASIVLAHPLRTVVLATTADQAIGLARELREDFALDTTAVLSDRLRTGSHPALRKAELIVTTQAHHTLIERIADRAGIPHICISIRGDLFESEWMLWHGQPVHVIVLDPRFRRIVQRFLIDAGAKPAAVRVHLADSDLSRIADDAPVYITQAARAWLGKTRVPGMPISPTRLLADDCVRALWTTIVAVNASRAAAATAE